MCEKNCRKQHSKKQLKSIYRHIKIFYANNSVSLDLKDKKSFS
jgi:hypothetical protein